MRGRPNTGLVQRHPNHGNGGQGHSRQGHGGHGRGGHGRGGHGRGGHGRGGHGRGGHGRGGRGHGGHGHEGHGIGGQGHARHGHDDHGHVGHGHRMRGHGNNVPEVPAEEVNSQRTPQELARRTVVEKVTDKCTQWWKLAVKMMPVRLRNFMQPSHFLMIAAIAVVSNAVFEHGAKMVYKFDADIVAKPRSSINFVYQLSFCLLIGSQYWMTIVPGLSLYFSLPRQAFAEAQKNMFPRYFSSCSFLSGIALSQFIKIYGNLIEWNFYTSLQFLALCSTFLLAASIRLYLVPPLLGILSAKVAIEKKAGVGTRVGRYDIGHLADCPHYVIINKAFRKIHSFMAAGNLVTMICSVVHLMCTIARPDTAVRG